MRAPGRIRKSTRMHMKSPKIPRFFGLHPVFEHARGPQSGIALRQATPQAGRQPVTIRTPHGRRPIRCPAMQNRPGIRKQPPAAGQRPDQYFPRHHAAMRSAMRASVEFEVFGS